MQGDLFEEGNPQPRRRRVKARRVASCSAGFVMREEFRAYHEANPQIWAMFQRYAFQLIRAGRTQLSAQLIFERMRWEEWLLTTGDDFKLNNNYRPDYARLFMHRFPQYDGYFETRSRSVGED